MPRHLYEGLPQSWDGITDDGRDATSVGNFPVAGTMSEASRLRALQVLKDYKPRTEAENMTQDEAGELIRKIIRDSWRGGVR